MDEGWKTPAARADERILELNRTALALDEHERSLAVREDELAEREALIVALEDSLEASVTELEEREVIQAAEQARLDRLAHSLSREEDRLAHEAALLAEREERFLARWRWLARTWRRTPLHRKGLQTVGLLFVPTADGYRLLPQDGIALRPGATLSGLVDDERSFVVTKIASLPFDERWCAYLQEAD